MSKKPFLPLLLTLVVVVAVLGQTVTLSDRDRYRLGGDNDDDDGVLTSGPTFGASADDEPFQDRIVVRFRRDAPVPDRPPPSTSGSLLSQAALSPSTTAPRAGSPSAPSKDVPPAKAANDGSSGSLASTAGTERGSGRGWTDKDHGEVVDVVNDVMVDIPDDRINETLKHHEINQFDVDDHKYYRSQFFRGEGWWVDLELLNTTQKGIVREHSMLSQSYRRAATIGLKFSFPFYGHNVSNITIATGGFLYTGDYVHSWLAATQYIAPLMANFDTSKSDKAKILYADNGTALIVGWDNVYLQGTEEAGHQEKSTSSPFSFQVILHKSGDIVFAYKSVPVTITHIEDKQHPVKVGLSDAYIIDRTIFFVRRKTIYEYHRVDMKDKAEITNHSAIYFKALPTCNGKMRCETCLDAVDEDGKDLNCKWCPKLGRCSDGMDRFRQDWLLKSCDSYNIVKGDPNGCQAVLVNPEFANRPTSGTSGTSSDRQDGKDFVDSSGINYDTASAAAPAAASAAAGGQGGASSPSGDGPKKERLASHGGIVTVSIVVLLCITMVAWFAYAYFFPHSWSGQLLIKYRPTRWQWRSEPRYTAASIHM